MNKREVLLEIGLEEMPARYVTSSIHQLAEKVTRWFEEHKIAFGEVKCYSTPRRLAVLVKDVSEKQDDIHEEVKGPAKKIALDENGNWTKAAIGFTRGQGMTVDDIFFKEINGVEYVYVKKYVKGAETSSLLPELSKIVKDLSFPIHMRWGKNDLKYIRPIKWIVAMFGKEVIPFTVANVTTSNWTMGHRFLGKKIEIDEPINYEQALLNEFVIADGEKRKERIVSQLKKLEEENNWIIPIDEDLLEEVTNIIEYPTAFYGQFEQAFLELPEKVLITSMKEHQRYFPVKSKEGKLLPYFVTVRNGNDKHIETVRKGNEKVLKARLADADFFYKEDQKLEIQEALNKLESVVFHEEIGTIADKMKRVRTLTNILADELNFSEREKKLADRAAEICKFDLVTQMVYEFPELQGFMGEKYAILKGEEKEVAIAINEHYMPRNAGDHPATTNVGALLSIAEKIDTIVSFFAIGIIPSGSQDPYALRRQASGVVHTLLQKNWSLSLTDVLQKAIQLAERANIKMKNKDQLEGELLSFFKLRIKYYLEEKGIRYDIIEAVLDGKIGDLPSLIQKANVLQTNKDTNGFKENIEALSRVLNIATKRDKVQDIRPDLFENVYEEKLYNEYIEVKNKIMEQVNEEEHFRLLVNLKHLINEYFNHTMVMAENEQIRNNRLNFMYELAQLIKGFANFNCLNVK